MSALAAAAGLAAQGLPVFFCRPDKRPACAHGFKDAVCDAAAVQALWRRSPGPLIGVPTGTASGFDVLDIDPRHGGERWYLANRHRFPTTRMHRTGSNGLHVLFRHAEPVRNTEGKLAPGVDTRGEGGYVVWWPAQGCRMADAPLAVWPAWLLDRLLRRPERIKPAQSAKPCLNPDDIAQRIAARALDRVGGAGAGQRHYTLRKAAYTIGGLLDRLPFNANEAVNRLCQAVAQAGAEDMENARKTALWALERGRATPLTMRDAR